MDGSTLSEAMSYVVEPIKSFLKWLTLESRVAKSVQHRAADEGIRVNRRDLRMHLYRTRFVSHLDEVSARQQLRQSLGVLTSGDAAQGDRLFELLEAAIQSRSSPVGATTAVGAALVERIDTLQDSLQTRDQDELLWESRLSRLRPIRAEAAGEVRQSWSRMPSVVGLLATGDREGILTSWGLNLPNFLAEAPAAVLCWLADLAADLGLLATAEKFFEVGIARGAYPLGYWEVRRAWASGSANDQQLTFADVDHPLVRARSLEFAGDTVRAVDVLLSWIPKIVAERATRDILLARVALNERDYEKAIALAMPLSRLGSTAATLIAARALISRELFTPSDLHHGDVAAAFSLLVGLRDSLREWGHDTGEVVVLASTAARLLNDPVRALALTQPAPQGEATESEAQTVAVRGAAAIMLAENGMLEAAESLVSDPGLDPTLSHHLYGLIAEASGDREAAAAYFARALDTSADPDAKGQFAYTLATLGQVHPFVHEQRAAGNVKFADELTLIADAFADRPGGVDKLRVAAHSSASLSMTLSQLYRSMGRADLELQSLRSAAERLGDPDVWLAAARLEKNASNNMEAINCAERALAAAPPSWGALVRTHALLVELFAAVGDWVRAIRSAETLVRLEPNNRSAIWALISCQYHAGESDAALGTWNSVAHRERPDSRRDVLVWLALCEEFGEAIASVEDLATVAAEWAADEEIRRHIVGLVLFPGSAGEDAESEEVDAAPAASDGGPSPEAELADPRQTTRAELIAGYFRDFPDGEIRQITLDLTNRDSIVDAITSAVGERTDTRELDAQVGSGQFPLGLATLAHGGTYAEAVISSASGVRFSISGDQDEISAAANSIQRPVVIDTTAVFTLVALPEPLRVKLLAQFPALAISSEQFRDAVAALQSITRFGRAHSYLTAFRGPVSLRAFGRGADDREIAEALVAMMRPLVRETRSRSYAHPELGDAFADDAWFGATAVAGTDRALWSDDLALNRIASDTGATAFSTLALVGALRQRGLLSATDERKIDVCLLPHRYVGIPFDASLYTDALRTAHGSPTALAAVIEHLDGAGGNGVLEYVLAQAPSIAANGPDLEQWVSGCIRWLARVSPDEAARASNLRLFTSRIVRSIWMLPQTFPYIDAGVTDGLDDSGDFDPLAEEIERAFRAMTRQDRAQAVRWVFDLIAGMDASRRHRYTGIALRP
ncbi:hypothetical protein ACPW96_17920 [Micromonospora sp. DT81.3]|uniref:hypothetical protein n=1 Tax=Micromonospora sp. DT81.3 TaxID=3416523 RepID=UPI003CE67B83